MFSLHVLESFWGYRFHGVLLQSRSCMVIATYMSTEGCTKASLLHSRPLLCHDCLQHSVFNPHVIFGAHCYQLKQVTWLKQMLRIHCRYPSPKNALLDMSMGHVHTTKYSVRIHSESFRKEPFVPLLLLKQSQVFDVSCDKLTQI